MSDNAALVALLTALADDELILGHRHSEWTGHAPHIEEDVAFSSIAQDEIGHAGAYYSLIAKLTDQATDQIALGREPSDYRNAVLCEQPNGNWAFTLARHWLYDHADDIRLAALESSSHEELSAIATKLRREERYHLLHADSWVQRISSGPVEGRARLIDAMTEAFTDAMGLFEPIELEEAAVKEGWLPVPSAEMKARFVERTTTALDDLGLPTEVRAIDDRAAEFVASSSGDLIENAAAGEGPSPLPIAHGLGGRKGRHSPDFEILWTEMTSTYQENPGATW
ncbi:MAG: phenylacetate-CoA oxygenase subunit PaaC [Actinobacteria bacterium]|nr:phenylacetate-CoA oxygenase subunit PaaC [Actinomycetota bacterium]